jgi:hypothetical protein
MKILPWYMLDKDGWPIERIIGRPIQNVLRIVIQNIKKLL